MKIPRPIERLIENFEKLPGIGPKSAQRLAFYLLHVPQTELENFAGALSNLKTQTKICSVCKNIGETDPCSICEKEDRDRATVCVVETPLDAMAVEKSGYTGLYHVLHGVINPLQNIGPDELYIDDLIKRLRSDNEVREVILATNPTMEGETTAFYISKLIQKNETGANRELKITRIGRGLPTGANLEYADETTLTRAFEGRTLL